MHGKVQRRKIAIDRMQVYLHLMCLKIYYNNLLFQNVKMNLFLLELYANMLNKQQLRQRKEIRIDI